MQRSRLFWLGFLGLLGLLGLVTGNKGMFGFFGFFAFGAITNDERLDASIAAAGRNAFFAGIAVFVVASLAASVAAASAPMLLGYALAAMFALEMLVFTASLVYYDRMGAAG